MAASDSVRMSSIAALNKTMVQIPSVESRRFDTALIERGSED